MTIRVIKFISLISVFIRFSTVIFPYCALGSEKDLKEAIGIKIPEKFVDVWMPFGIAFDNDGNLLVSHSERGGDGISINEHLSKYSNNGELLNTVITAGFFDPAVVSGNFVLEPSSGKILCICHRKLVSIDPNTLSVTNLFSIEDLDIDEENIYDVELQKVNNLLTISPEYASYGDLALFNRQNSIDLYLSGSDYSTIPFILKIKMSQDFSVLSAQVIVASTSALMVVPAPSFSAPGIAINQDGTIVTTLPQTFESISSAPNVLFAFNVDFDPADGIQPGEEPRLIFHKDDAFFNSTGMTCDSRGIFYITTDFTGAFVSEKVCDKNIESFYNASLVILSESLDRILDVIYPPTSEIKFVDFGDVVLSPDEKDVFISVFEYTDNPYGLEDFDGRIVYYTISEYTSLNRNENFTEIHYQLKQNYPNPFNSATTIPFSIPENESVKITVFNILGQTVSELVNKEIYAGEHRVYWNGNDLPSGNYFYRMQTSKFSRTMKLNLVK